MLKLYNFTKSDIFTMCISFRFRFVGFGCKEILIGFVFGLWLSVSIVKIFWIGFGLWLTVSVAVYKPKTKTNRHCFFVRIYTWKYSNEFFGSCRTFWMLTITPSDQNWSTFVTSKVIRNYFNFRFFRFSGFSITFNVTEVLQFSSNGIIIAIQNVLHDPENSLE